METAKEPDCCMIGKPYARYNSMRLSDLLKSYHALPPADRAVFAAIVRAHQAFNGPLWKSELARRHRLMDGGGGACKSLGEIEALAARLDVGNGSGAP